MSSGFATAWERHDTAVVVRSWLAELSVCGWRMVNPTTGVSSRLDRMGVDVPVSDPEDLPRVVDEEGVLTLQLWRSPDADLIWAVRRVEAMLHQVWVSFSGHSAGSRALILRLLVSRFRRLSSALVAAGLVVDQGGDSAEFDWDGFVRGHGGPPALLPDILGVRAELAAKVSRESARGGEERVGGCVLFFSAPEWRRLAAAPALPQHE